jgi:PAS domain S-box-containing protein
MTDATKNAPPEFAPNGQGASAGPPGPASARIAHLLDAIGDIYFTLDHDWRFVYLNCHALRRARRTAAELLGRVIWEVYPEMLGTPLEVHYRRAMSTGETVRFEMPGLFTGTWYEVHACPCPEGLTVHGRDITAQRRAQLALQESEGRFRAISELTSDYTFACRIEPDGRSVLETASEGFRTVTGYTLAEVEARGGWPVLVHPDDMPETRRAGEDNLAGRKWTGELRLLTRHGETRWVRSSTWPIYDPRQGRVVRLLGAAQDITERKRAELALRASEELNRRILQSVHAGVITVARDGSMLQINAAGQRILGVDHDALLQKYVHDFGATTFYEDGRPFPVEEYPVSKCLATGQPQPAVTIGARRADGEIAWAVYNAEPLLDPQTGGLAGAVVTFVDITPRKRMEQALRESEERLRRFFAAAFEGLVIHEGGVILDANEAFAAMFGYAVPEVIGRNVVDLAASADRALVRAALKTGREQPYQGLGLRKDGSTFPCELHGKNIRSDGHTLRVTALRDITERVRAEEQLRHYAERLQDLSRRLLEVQEAERRHLARELHDEIGQSLTALQLVLKGGADPSPERRAEALCRAQRLVAELTGQVRDLSQSLRPTMLDDLGLLPALLWHLRRYTAQTGVQVHFEHHGLGGRFPPAVETAAYRIVQEALTNVARHAGVGEATVAVWHDGARLRIRVEDRGASFDPAAVRAAGAGSGLSGMHERAALLGGRLVVQSTPGAGTRLTAELPLGTFAEEKNDTDADATSGG